MLDEVLEDVIVPAVVELNGGVGFVGIGRCVPATNLKNAIWLYKVSSIYCRKYDVYLLTHNQ